MVIGYTYRDHPIKQMQIAFITSNQKLIYAWGYTAPAAEYENYLPVAKAMFESWVLHDNINKR